MNLRTFRAPTMAQALADVKRAFGGDAVILHTRTVDGGGVLGYRKQRTVEITASKDAFSLPSGTRRPRVPRGSKTTAVGKGAADVTRGPDTAPRSANYAALSDEVASLKSAVGDLVAEARAARIPSLPESLRNIYQNLIETQVAEDIASGIVRELGSVENGQPSRDPSRVRTRLAEFVESMLPYADPATLGERDAPRVLALVGPTGVGKTTTIAKLAADYRLRRGLDVGLVTLDTYRIAAVEQLRTYARIIDVPLAVVSDPDQMRRAVLERSDCDIILIDTAGCAPNDADRLRELRGLLVAAGVDEVHLVLSATCGTAASKHAMERFSTLNVNRMIFTKLDEAVGFGVILNCLRHAEAGLSYVTMGQAVPEDIATGREARLPSLIAAGAESGPAPLRDAASLRLAAAPTAEQP